eukprot:m.106495 g.106495  ORF g.106495 m.106495 type:complete len:70 (+) comp9154_c0_seq1:1271-1480(+)
MKNTAFSTITNQHEVESINKYDNINYTIQKHILHFKVLFIKKFTKRENLAQVDFMDGLQQHSSPCSWIR